MMADQVLDLPIRLAQFLGLANDLVDICQSIGLYFPHRCCACLQFAYLALGCDVLSF